MPDEYINYIFGSDVSGLVSGAEDARSAWEQTFGAFQARGPMMPGGAYTETATGRIAGAGTVGEYFLGAAGVAEPPLEAVTQAAESSMNRMEQLEARLAATGRTMPELLREAGAAPGYATVWQARGAVSGQFPYEPFEEAIGAAEAAAGATRESMLQQVIQGFAGGGMGGGVEALAGAAGASALQLTALGAAIAGVIGTTRTWSAIMERASQETERAVTGITGGVLGSISAVPGGMEAFTRWQTGAGIAAGGLAAGGIAGGAGAGAAIGLAGGPLGALVGAGIGATAAWIGSAIYAGYEEAAQKMRAPLISLVSEAFERGIGDALRVGDIQRLLGGGVGGVSAGMGLMGAMGGDLGALVSGMGGMADPMMRARLAAIGVYPGEAAGGGIDIIDAMMQTREQYQAAGTPLERQMMLQMGWGGQAGAMGRFAGLEPEQVEELASAFRDAAMTAEQWTVAQDLNVERLLLGARVQEFLYEALVRVGPIAIEVFERFINFLDDNSERLFKVIEAALIMLEERLERQLGGMMEQEMLGRSRAAVRPWDPLGLRGMVGAGQEGPTPETAGYGAGRPSVDVNLYVREKPDWMELYAEQVAEARYREVTRG